jgi:hypothetical protein
LLLSLLSLFALLCWLPPRLPCPQTPRLWLLRVGLFLLRRAVPFRTDWVWIVDHTIRIGQHKCLLILGVSLQRLRNLDRALEHRDVTVLALHVGTSCTGEDVAGHFRDLAGRAGVPAQIVSDHGADLAKGVRLFQKEHVEVVDTYDATHKLACLTKHHLEADPRWGEMLKEFTKTLFVLQQSAGAFLMPAVPRQRSRYLNVSGSIGWAERMLTLLQAKDLGEIPTLLNKPEDQARAFLQEKLGWLRHYEEDVRHYGRLREVLAVTQEEVKTRGLGGQTKQRVWEQLSEGVRGDERVADYLEGVRRYLEEEGKKPPEGENWLGTSDVIESLFGKYKLEGEKAPYAAVGANVLLLPVMTVDLTEEMVDEALSTVSVRDLRQWLQANTGRSTLSKLKAANKVIESAETLEPDTKAA